MTNATHDLWISSTPGTPGHQFSLVRWNRVIGLAVGLLSTAVAALALDSAVQPLPFALQDVRLEPVRAEQTTTAELPREWRWTARAISLDSMYAGQR